MQAVCNQENHSNKALNLICTNPSCKSDPLLCFKCLQSYHNDCFDYVLEIDGLNTRMFSENMSWFQDPIISKAIKFNEDSRGKKDKTHSQVLKEEVEKEFKRILEYFITKIEEAKQIVLNNVERLCGKDQGILKDFFNKLRHLYNFDSFLGILEPLKQKEINIAKINKELRTFLDQIQNQVDQRKELHQTALKVNSLSESLKINQTMVKEFKESINFDLLANIVETKAMNWTWSSEMKSDGISLYKDGLEVKREKTDKSYSTVLGTTEFNEKTKYEWEIEVFSENSHHEWICFGIVESSIAKELLKIAFPYNSTLGYTTYGQVCNIKKVYDNNAYDNQKYLCILDLENGTFSISCEGKLICKESSNLQDKKFFPFVMMYSKGNRASLRVLT